MWTKIIVGKRGIADEAKNAFRLKQLLQVFRNSSRLKLRITQGTLITFHKLLRNASIAEYFIAIVVAALFRLEGKFFALFTNQQVVYWLRAYLI